MSGPSRPPSSPTHTPGGAHTCRRGSQRADGGGIAGRRGRAQRPRRGVARAAHLALVGIVIRATLVPPSCRFRTITIARLTCHLRNSTLGSSLGPTIKPTSFESPSHPSRHPRRGDRLPSPMTRSPGRSPARASLGLSSPTWQARWWGDLGGVRAQPVALGHHLPRVHRGHRGDPLLLAPV